MPFSLPNQCLLQPVQLPWVSEAGCQLAVLRLDLLHPQVSGNKWFKLQPYIEQMQREGKRGLISLGGPHSNHLHALAGAAALGGFSAVALMRGPAQDTPTVNDLQQQGVTLHWLTREAYRQRQHTAFVAQWQQQYPDHVWVPEGGDGVLGQQGAGQIMPLLEANLAALDWAGCDALFTAVGTGTTWLGMQAQSKTPVWGLLAVPRHYLAPALRAEPQLVDAHRQGFGRVDDELLSFVSAFQCATGVPLDPVYTGKALMALRQMLRAGKFARGSRLVFVHTGGLQGTRATPNWPRLDEVAA